MVNRIILTIGKRWSTHKINTETTDKIMELLKDPTLVLVDPNDIEDIEEPDDDDEWLFWPTEFPGAITQAFGINPQWYKGFGLPGHEGLDMKAYDDTKIFAAWEGEITRVEKNEDASNYGIHVRTKCTIDGDEYKMTYAHFKSVVGNLKVGDHVEKGQVIGRADSTGNSTGSHLHFTLKKVGATASGETDFPYDIIDPTRFFKELE